MRYSQNTKEEVKKKAEMEKGVLAHGRGIFYKKTKNKRGGGGRNQATQRT